MRQQNTDLRRRHIGGVRRRRLGNHLILRHVGNGDSSDRREIEAAFSKIHGGHALRIADQIRNLGALWPETLGNTYMPSPTHPAVRSRRLGNDLAHGNAGAIEPVFHRDGQTIPVCCLPRLPYGHSNHVWDAHLSSVDGKTHCGQGGEKRDQEEDQRPHYETKEPHACAPLCRQIVILRREMKPAYGP